MRKLSILLLLFVSVASFSKEIKFKELTYEKALQKAKKSNKLVFIDFYTSWCGPCKHMAQNVFTDDRVGKFFNKNFICLKIDAESEEGKKLAFKYRVKGYPTCIFANGTGKMIHDCIGCRPVDQLLEEGKNALLMLQVSNQF